MGGKDMNDSQKTTGIIVGVIALIAIIGGVVWMMSSNEDEMEETTTTQTTQHNEATTANDTMDAAQDAQDIVALASGTTTLSTLVQAVQAADLVETLQGEGPFTVLAPTNDAFAALPEGTLDTLLEPANKDDLAGILTYHVISGEVMSGNLDDGQVVTTVNGETLTVELTDNGVFFVDVTGARAQVTQADVAASNGVVHIIDRVLLPQ